MELQNEVAILKRANTDLIMFSYWEPEAHNQFMRRLEKNGLTEKDIDAEGLDEIRAANIKHGYGTYYKGVC